MERFRFSIPGFFSDLEDGLYKGALLNSENKTKIKLTHFLESLENGAVHFIMDFLFNK